MALRDKERYFWLKLHRDFFKRHDIRVLEKKQNGKELVLLFLKLMTESLDHEGVLRFSEDLPYTEEMLACVTDTDPEVLRAGIQSFQELGMLQVQEDGTILIPVVERLVGSETHQNRRKREAMQRKADENPDLFLSTCGVKLTPEKEIESETNIETDTDTDSDTEIEELTAPKGAVCRTEDVRRVMQAWNSLGLQQLTVITASSRRGIMLRARLMEYGLEAVLEAIEKIRNNAFLQGQNRKGWVITFEWFVRPNNFLKVLEGNYEPYHPVSAKKTANPFLAMLLEEADDKD